MTEQEVVNGIILPNNNVDHTLAFIREIRNINIGLIHHAGKYIDINMAEKKVDQEAVDLLNLLKNIKVMMISLLSKKKLKLCLSDFIQVPNKLDAANIIPVSLEWSDSGGMNAVDHAQYLKEVGEIFYLRIKELIERALKKRMKLCQNKYIYL